MASSESDDKELQKQLHEAGNRLLDDPPSSDVELLALLEQVERDLSRVEQSPSESMKSAISPSLKALVAKEFMNHPNEDIKIAVASCISEITRVTAPDAPYDDNQMKDVFQLIVSSFEKLPDKNSRSYDKRIAMLETVSKVRSCVVMLDLECDLLITEMLQYFLKTIRDYHPDIVYSSMENIMTLVLEESEEITLELLSPILAALRKDNEDVTIIARRLGEKVLQNCAAKIRPTIVQSVNSSHISLENYSVAVANVCQEPSDNVGNNDLNTSSEHLVNASKLANGTSQNEASQVALEAATHGVVDPDPDCLPKPITSNGVTLAKTEGENSLVESDSLKLPKHSDEIKQSKSDGPSNTEHCSMGADNTTESEVTAEKTTKNEGESLITSSVEAVPLVVNAKEPSVANATEPLIVNATEPLIVNATEASIVTPIEPLASGTEPAISSSNIANKEQETLLGCEETQSKEVSSSSHQNPSAEAVVHADSKVDANTEKSSPMTLESDSAKVASPSASGNLANESGARKDGISKDSLVPSTASLGIVADKMSEGTIDSELKTHTPSGKKVPARVSKKGTSSTCVDSSNEDSGTDSVPEPKPESREVSKKVDRNEDLVDDSPPKKVGGSKERLLQPSNSADTVTKKLSESSIDLDAKAHQRSSKKTPAGIRTGGTSPTTVNTSKEDSGAISVPEVKPKTLRVVSKEFDTSEDLADKSRPKKAGRSKESLAQTKVSADSGPVKLAEDKSDSKAKAHKQSGKREPAGAPKEDASSTRIDTSKEDSGTDTETTPLAEVSTKSDKKDGNLHESSKKQKSKKSGKGKANVEKDTTKSSAKDVDKDTISTSKSATKNKGKDTLAETLGAISKRKRTPAKVIAVSDSKESGDNLVGKRIKVWWPDDKEFYEGTVESWDPSDKKHKIVYNDGDEEVLLLKNEKWQLVEGDSVTDVGEGADALTPDALPETHAKKKSKKNIGSSSKQGKTTTSPKSGGAVSSSKSKGAATKSSGKSKDDTKEEPKTKDQTPKGDVKSTDVPKATGKSKNVGASSGSKKTEPETPKTPTAKSKGKSPKITSTPSNTSTGKGKSDSSKVKESEDVKVKSPDSSKAHPDAKRKTPETSSKAQESKGKSVNKRRRKK